MLINIGYENYIGRNLFAVVMKPESSHAKKLRQNATEKGLLINATSGHKTRSVIVLATGQVVLSFLQTTTLAARVNAVKKILINIGYGNFINAELVAATLIKPDSSHAKKLRQNATEKGLLINATSGHKTRSVIVLATGQVVLSSIKTVTFRSRASKREDNLEIKSRSIDPEPFDDEPF